MLQINNFALTLLRLSTQDVSNRTSPVTANRSYPLPCSILRIKLRRGVLGLSSLASSKGNCLKHKIVRIVALPATKINPCRGCPSTIGRHRKLNDLFVAHFQNYNPL